MAFQWTDGWLSALAMKRSALWSYSPQSAPHCNQLAFHQDASKIRFVTGAVRSGKTMVGVAELAAILLDQRPPWLNWPAYPQGRVRAWIVIPQFPKSIDETSGVLEKLFKGEPGTDRDGKACWRAPMIPAGMIANFDQSAWLWTLSNGNSVQVRASTQRAGNFAGSAPHLIYIDEPTTDLIWAECRSRLVAEPTARMIHCATFVDGGGTEAHYPLEVDHDPAVGKHRFMSTSNQYIDQQRLADLSAGLTADQQAVRIGGATIQGLRLVHPEANMNSRLDPPDPEDDCGTRTPERPEGLTRRIRGNWVRPFEIPADWTRYQIVDPGVANPAASGWVAVDPKGNHWWYRFRYLQKPNNSAMETMRYWFRDLDPHEPIRRRFFDPNASAPAGITLGRPHRSEKLIDIYREALRILKAEGWVAEWSPTWEKGPTEVEKNTRIARAASLGIYLHLPNRDLTTTRPAYHTKSLPTTWLFGNPGCKHMAEVYKEFRQYVRPKQRVAGRNQHEHGFEGHDHAMYCLEAAASMKLGWLPPNGAGGNRPPVKLSTLEEQISAGFAEIWGNRATHVKT